MFKLGLETKKATKAYMSKFPQMLRRGFVLGVKESIGFAEEQAKKSFGSPNKPKSKTGRLKNSIRSSFKSGKSVTVGTLKSDEVYARIQEEGGIIRAKASKYLTFPISGSWVKVPSVRIPARPYLRPAIEDNLRKIETIITLSVIKGVR